MRLKRYLKNLLRNLTGRNPFRQEQEDQKRLYKEMQELREAKEKAWQQVRDYQNLTENLRKRITEKVIENGRQRHDYTLAVNTLRKQHWLQCEELKQKNQELRDDLDATQKRLLRVYKDIGREMMNTNMLAKTNNALNDLCQAMASEDVEKMKAVVEYLEWSTPLSQVAQYHLNLLMRVTNL